MNSQVSHSTRSLSAMAAAAGAAGGAAAVFAELCARFQIEDAVRDQIVNTGVTTLSEFRPYVTTSGELEGAFIAPIQANLNARLQYGPPSQLLDSSLYR